MKIKKSVAITITNLDDLNGVLISLEKFLQAILYYYINKKDNLKSLMTFVLSLSVYCGQLLKILGYNDEDLKEK